MCAVLAVAFALAVGYFADRWFRAQAELSTLRRQAQLESGRLRETRFTVLDQQSALDSSEAQAEEFKVEISRQIDEFKAELSEIDRLGNQVRAMLALTTPTPTTSPSPVSRSSQLDPALVSSLGAARATSPSSRGPRPIATPPTETFQTMASLRQGATSRLAELKGLISAAGEYLGKLEALEQASQAQFDEAFKALSAVPRRCPVDEGYYLTSPFGYRNDFGYWEFHEGIDIGVGYGTEVHATQDGVVIFSGWNERFGYIVAIEHDMGFVTRYGHCSRLLVNVGQRVQVGEVIALSGSTGRTSGPHLHYEIWRDGVVVDPLQYMVEP